MSQIIKAVADSVESIKALEEINASRPQVEIETIERFMGSMYSREIFIPKGTVITSRVYKRGYVDIMLSGDITITDANGVRRLSGCNILEGTAGRKRAGYAHEDTHWITVHDMFDIKTNPLDDISFEKLEEHEKYSTNLAKQSYNDFLLEFDVKDNDSTEELQAIESDSFYVAGSKISGKGLFASRPFKTGEIIGARKQLERFVNHSGYPNAGYVGENIMATRAIDTGSEFTISYNRGSLWQES